MRTSHRLPLLAVALALAASACTGAAPPPTAPPSEPPSGAIEHATGPTDVLLRYDEGGGFVPIEWSLTNMPIFTLYGDGTVIFRDPMKQSVADVNGILVQEPLRTARLSEEQIQGLLAFAVNQGGLGVARDRYDNPMIADAGTATFTINAGGRTKTVSVTALTESSDNTPDPLIRVQFKALADRLRQFDEGGAIATDEYTPHAQRAVLVETEGILTKNHPWPWPDLTLGDFAPMADDPAMSTWPMRVLTADQVAVLGLGELKGGLQGYYIEGPDGKTYGLPIRPLLPDEEA